SATDGSPAEDVALKAQLCPSPDEVSAWSRRQVLRHLAELQAHGLAQVSAEGTWTRPQELPTLPTPAERYVEVKQRITLERQTFREAPSQWVRDQRAALQACRQRAADWWASRSPLQRQQRTRRLSAAFSERSVWRQHEQKRGWEERNLRCGVDLVRRYEVWMQAQDAREFERRCEQRRIWFANLPQPLRQAYAAAWQEHRERYGYPAHS
ncbi:hypothetical protein, partial [Dermacoccus nishinomiyaensis]|uniref:hypothetical protein n=1 Tax=Dermacoccus nishinomiyaensis TaxID=1274 RepID=UPI000B183D45